MVPRNNNIWSCLLWSPVIVNTWYNGRTDAERLMPSPHIVERPEDSVCITCMFTAVMYLVPGIHCLACFFCLFIYTPRKCGGQLYDFW